VGVSREARSKEEKVSREKSAVRQRTEMDDEQVIRE
jgi:hypothetical protein